ncbi:MAG: AgmX/PglI C-terminal domain-containing protein [Myxococcota bacterium]
MIEEQRLRKRKAVTIGWGPKNTFVIPDNTLPRSHHLFAVSGGKYELVLTEAMRGRVSVAGKSVDFASLKAQGVMQKKGNFYHLPLTDQHRGKVVIGDIMVIFQFVVPPPPAVKPKLPAAARGNIFEQIDWPYAAALAAVMIIELPAVTYFHFAPRPEELSLENIDDRWAKLIVPERKKEDIKKPDELDTPDGVASAASKKKAATKSGSKKVKDPEAVAKARKARSDKIRKSIAGRGMLAILGTTGGGAADGAVADVFSSGTVGGDLDDAFEGISGVGIATGTERTTRGGGSGESASIGGLATAGGGKVGLGGKREAAIGTIATAAPEVDGALDTAAIARVVRQRKRSLQDCYERELKRDPTLSGRIEIEFTIDESGRVVEARVSANRMGSNGVGDCIVARIRRWRFPKPDGGDVTVNFPFIFTPAG